MTIDLDDPGIGIIWVINRPVVDTLAAMKVTMRPAYAWASFALLIGRAAYRLKHMSVVLDC